MITEIIKNRSFFLVLGIFSFVFSFAVFWGINDYLNTGDKIFWFSYFLLSLFCFYIFLYSFIVFAMFKRRIMKIVKAEIKWIDLKKVREDSLNIGLTGGILKFVVDITKTYSNLEKKEFLKLLRKKISNLAEANLQKLADLFLKHEARILEIHYVNEEQAQEELSSLLTREKEKEKRKVYKNNSLLRGTIERFLEAHKTAKVNSRKNKKAFESSKSVVRMMGLEAWNSHVPYLKLDVESL